MSITGCEGDHDFPLDCESCVREIAKQVSATSRWCADRPEDAAEIGASALERIVRSTRRGNGWRPGGSGTLRTWAARVTQNASTDWHRQQRRVRRRAEWAAFQPPGPAPDPLLEVEYVRAIETYLERVPTVEAFAMRFFIYEQYTLVEIGEVLGKSPQWWGRVVKKHASRIAELIWEPEIGNP